MTLRGANAPSGASPARHLALKVTGYPFTTRERCDFLLLSCGSLVDAVGARTIARAVLETESLAEAAQQLVALAGSAASLALVRWVR